ncbi:MAG: phenylalanine--tRNA ligase subunit alpha [Candidatus Atabeyarchaeum deiterrae]
MSNSTRLDRVEALILQTLATTRTRIDLNELVEDLKLDQATIIGAATMLSQRGFLKIYESAGSNIRLTSEGVRCFKFGLPERIIIDYIVEKGHGTAEFESLKRDLSLSEEEAAIALGWLKRKNWASAAKDGGRLYLRSSTKPSIGSDEALITELSTSKEVPISSLKKEYRDIISSLQKRKLVDIVERRSRSLEITNNGLELSRHGITVFDEVTQLTPEMIRSGDWRTANFKTFDVSASVEPVFVARYHPIVELIEEVREIFLELGFEEIKGNLVESAFWNFDVLFQPQDHPAREMHDTFYLSTPSKAKLPDQSIVRRIAQTHEDGWETGSTGWGYKWSPEVAQKVILRTHTTATTIRYLASHPNPPLKVFSVDRVYRNEKVNYKHLAEFHQVEGIVMDRDVSLRDLMGIIKEFYGRLGFRRVQFWPSYFPYTEPSAEAIVYIEKKAVDQDGKVTSSGRWLELGGMGIFRPEVTKPLDIKYPVLAWGLGLERLLMIRLELGDIRIPYRNELTWLRSNPQKQ